MGETSAPLSFDRSAGRTAAAMAAGRMRQPDGSDPAPFFAHRAGSRRLSPRDRSVLGKRPARLQTFQAGDSHAVDDFDSKQIEAEFQGLGRQVAYRQTAVAPGGRLGLEDRTFLEEGGKRVGQVKQIIGQDVGFELRRPPAPGPLAGGGSARPVPRSAGWLRTISGFCWRMLSGRVPPLRKML